MGDDDPWRQVLDRMRTLGQRELHLAIEMASELGVDTPLADLALHTLAPALGFPAQGTVPPAAKTVVITASAPASTAMRSASGSRSEVTKIGSGTPNRNSARASSGAVRTGRRTGLVCRPGTKKQWARPRQNGVCRPTHATGAAARFLASCPSNATIRKPAV